MGKVKIYDATANGQNFGMVDMYQFPMGKVKVH